ncbi:MAG: 4-hydroxy-2-oxovalerate aldolase, partial [Caulobacteraceae bacterium]|nr:4-hydroxy-2-oxovalerate aldolase [Caulobacteraceae bacterium]
MSEFRNSVKSGRTLLGCFIKTASHQVVELVARAGQDFAIVDAEHAPFDLLTLDRMALAARATDLTLLVRIPDHNATFVGQVLDMGFDGVLAPHVASPEAATHLVEAALFEAGKRGFSPSTRAGQYGGVEANAYRRAADAAVSVWGQIEDAEALPQLDAIAAVDRLDCLFLGRADLAGSLGVDSIGDERVQQAVRATAVAGAGQGKAVGIY